MKPSITLVLFEATYDLLLSDALVQHVRTPVMTVGRKCQLA